MSDWRRWIWPGITATALLTVLAVWFRADHVETDLASKALTELGSAHPWASVSLSGRDLVMTGVAPSEEAQAQALAIARNAYDVRVAIDRSELLAIADPYAFKAVKSNDKIVLSGNVPDSATRAALVAAVETAMPGIAVEDQMTDARGMPDGFGELTSLGIAQLSDLTTGEAAVSNGSYSIAGQAIDSAAYISLQTALADALPGGAQAAKVDVVAPAIDGPYTWRAERAADTVTLSGFVPSVAERDALLAVTKTRFPDATIDDQLAFASGAPAQYSGYTGFALDQLARLSSGAVALAGSALAISGETLDATAFTAAGAALAGKLPDGLAVETVDISPPPPPPAPVSPAPQEPAPEAPEPAAPVAAAIDAPPQALEDFKAINGGLDVTYFLAPGVTLSPQCVPPALRALGANYVNFESGSAVIALDNTTALDKVLAFASQCDDYRLEVEGHSDAEGADDANLVLSQQRADAVRDYLVGKGVSADRIQTVGKGEAEPIADNGTEEGRRRNRRIVIRIIG
jgi:outer membrane protein OmpA-like peptidoglycan-associated protein